MPNSANNLVFAMHKSQLRIYWGDEFSHSIRLWPRPLAEELSERTNRWERFYPEFRIVSYPLPKPKAKNKNQLELALDVTDSFPPSKLSKRRAYDQLRQTLPPSYGFALAPFKCHQWSVIVCLWKYRRYYELLRSNPVMAFILANDQRINWGVYLNEMSMEKIIEMKQTTVMELLDLPGSKSMMQLFRKIHPSAAHPQLRSQIRFCLQDDNSMKQLSHLKKINAGVLHLLASVERIRSHVTPQLLEEVSQSRQNNHYPFAAHQLGECERWHTQIYQNRKFPKIRSVEKLVAYHEELAAEVDRLLQVQREEDRAERERELERAMKAPFPKPPVPGTDEIVPLRTAGDLIMEGQQQHNCVGHYSQSVQGGGCYIYRVLKPERATLSIVRYTSGQWSIGELSAACNRQVQHATKQSVERWLAARQLGI